VTRTAARTKKPKPVSELWTAEQCVAWMSAPERAPKVRRMTTRGWLALTRDGGHGKAPRRYTTAGRTPLWDPPEVMAWHEVAPIRRSPRHDVA
jgi:hypothetical protein